MSGISSNPARSPFTQFSPQQMLILILTEMRLQTRIQANEMGFDEDLDQLRVQIMNDGDMFVDPQGATGA